MNWVLILTKTAKKQLKKIPHSDSKRILFAIAELKSDIFSGDIKKLYSKENIFRKRVGSYRIFYKLKKEGNVILIADIKRRTSKTY